MRATQNQIVGVDDDEGPPVPIPNTEVKLISADDTWLATARDNRKAPTPKQSPNRVAVFFYFCFAFFAALAVLAPLHRIYMAQLCAGRMFRNKPETTVTQGIFIFLLFFCMGFYIILFNALKHKVIKVQMGVIV